MTPSDNSDRQSVDRPNVNKAFAFDALDTVLRQPEGSLDSDLASTKAIIDEDKRRVDVLIAQKAATKNRLRLARFSVIGILILAGVGVAAFRHFNPVSKHASQVVQQDASQKYSTVSVPLADLNPAVGLSVQHGQSLSVNGQLNVNNSLVIAPAGRPSTAVAGQIYFDQTSNQLSYYNGKAYVSLSQSPEVPLGVSSIGSATGAVSVGSGITVANKALSNSGVLTLQGQAGNVSLTGGPGLVVNGTTLSNSGLLSLGGASGDITVGNGLGLTGKQLKNTGIISAVGAGIITVTNDGNGNITIDGPSSGVGGTGTVASPGGTIGKIAKFTGVQTIADSLISDNGSVVTVGGNLSVTGSLNLSTPLAVSSGGTGSTTAVGARTNLGAAASGANSDITSLAGLTTALTVAQGGIGVGTLATNGVLVGNGTSPLTSLVAGSAGQCLVSGAGAPLWTTCPGSGGVTSLNGLNGVLNLANASAVGSTVTINDATTAAKGIASFNSANFSVTAGSVNTIQNIATTAAPTFGQLTLTSNQASNPMFVVNNTNSSATGSLLDLQQNGSSRFNVSPGGNINASGTLNGQNISATANFTGSVAVGTTLSVNTITPSSALTVGSTGQTFLLQGNASSTLTATNGASKTTVGFQSPTANVTYNFQTATAGTYNVCTTAGNCVGVGGSVSTPGGTTNRIAKFTAGSTVGDSIISDNGSTVTITGALSVNTLTPTAALTVGASGQNLTLQGATVSLSSTSAGITNALVFSTPSGSNKTITLPNATGTVAVSASGPLSLDASGNLTCPTCLTTGGGGSSGVTSLNGLTGGLTLQGSSAGSVTNGGTTITINDASSSTKGLASFNATNLTVTSGNVNTVQDIAVTAAPTFAGLTLTSALSVTNGGTGATTAANARTNLSAAKSGANSDITSLSGLTTAISVAQGGTGIATTPTNGQILIGNGTGYSLNTLSAGSGVTITNGAGTITISAPGSGTCAGCANTALSNLASVALNTSLLPGTAGAADLGSSTLPFGQLYLSGTSASPATNGFKITGASTGGQRTINLPDASGTVAVSASGYLNLSAAGNLSFNGTLAVTDGGTGANTAAGARTSLSAAKSGANSDITSLSGLTTALSVAQGGTGLGSLVANQLLFANSTSTISQVSNGTSGQCLVSNGAGSAPTFQACTGAGGVATLNGLNGALSINNTSGVGSTITIDNAKADGLTKGIATFNSTNFSDNGSGVINTIQGIATTSSPTFSNLTISSVLTTNTISPTAAMIVGATGQTLTLQGDASSKLTATSGGITTTIGFTGTPSGAVRYNFDRAAAAGTYNICTSAGNCSAGGVTTAGGTAGKIAKFTASGAIGDSLLSESGNVVTVAGAATFQNATDSTSAFNVNTSTGASLLKVDTSHGWIGINNSGPIAAIDVVGTGPAYVNGFESGVLGDFTRTGSNWQVVATGVGGTHTGGAMARLNPSSDPTDQLQLTKTLTSSGTISFWTYCDSAWNQLAFKIDGGAGTIMGNCSGWNKGPWTFSSFAVGAGTHTFSWYFSGGSYQSYTYMYLDDVIVTNVGTGTAALFNNGSVGIGLGTGIQPTATLDVNGTIQGTSSISLGTSSATDGTVVLKTATNANTLSIKSAAQTGNYTLTVPVLTANDTLCTVGLANCSGTGIGGSGTTGKIAKFTASGAIGDSIMSENSGALSVQGSAVFQNATNSTNAFSILNSTGASAFVVDTTNRRVGINNANPGATLDVNASSSDFTTGFETGLLSPLTVSGAGWTTSGSNPHSGAWSARTSGNSVTTTMTLTRTLNAAGNLSFYINSFMGGTGCTNNINFQIDGVVQQTWGCNTNYPYTLRSYSLAAGTHTFAWVVGAFSTTSYYVAVDDIIVTNSGAGTTALFNGGNVGIGTSFPNATLEVDGTGLFKAATDGTSIFQIQNASGTSLFNADTTNTTIKVSGTTTTFAIFQIDNAHFKSTQTTAPTIGNTGCTGTSTVTANSTDSAGSFSMPATSSAACVITVTFNKAYGAAPKSVLITPTTSNFGAVDAYVSSTTATTFVVTFTNAATNGQTYSYNYWVIE